MYGLPETSPEIHTFLNKFWSLNGSILFSIGPINTKLEEGAQRKLRRLKKLLGGSILHPSQYVIYPAAKKLPHCQV